MKYAILTIICFINLVNTGLAKEDTFPEKVFNGLLLSGIIGDSKPTAQIVYVDVNGVIYCSTKAIIDEADDTISFYGKIVVIKDGKVIMKSKDPEAQIILDKAGKMLTKGVWNIK